MVVEGHRREGNRGGREMGLVEMDIWLLELEIRKLVYTWGTCRDEHVGVGGGGGKDGGVEGERWVE